MPIQRKQGPSKLAALGPVERKDYRDPIQLPQPAAPEDDSVGLFENIWRGFAQGATEGNYGAWGGFVEAEGWREGNREKIEKGRSIQERARELDLAEDPLATHDAEGGWEWIKAVAGEIGGAFGTSLPSMLGGLTAGKTTQAVVTGAVRLAPHPAISAMAPVAGGLAGMAAGTLSAGFLSYAQNSGETFMMLAEELARAKPEMSDEDARKRAASLSVPVGAAMAALDLTGLAASLNLAKGAVKRAAIRRLARKAVDAELSEEAGKAAIAESVEAAVKAATKDLREGLAKDVAAQQAKSEAVAKRLGTIAQGRLPQLRAAMTEGFRAGAKGYGVEALTEGGQAGIQQAVAAAETDDTDARKRIEAALWEGAIGGFVGGGIAGGGRAYSAAKDIRDIKKKARAEQTPAEAEAERQDGKPPSLVPKTGSDGKPLTGREGHPGSKDIDEMIETGVPPGRDPNTPQPAEGDALTREISGHFRTPDGDTLSESERVTEGVRFQAQRLVNGRPTGEPVEYELSLDESIPRESNPEAGVDHEAEVAGKDELGVIHHMPVSQFRFTLLPKKEAKEGEAQPKAKPRQKVGPPIRKPGEQPGEKPGTEGESEAESEAETEAEPEGEAGGTGPTPKERQLRPFVDEGVPEDQDHVPDGTWVEVETEDAEGNTVIHGPYRVDAERSDLATVGQMKLAVTRADGQAETLDPGKLGTVRALTPEEVTSREVSYPETAPASEPEPAAEPAADGNARDTVIAAGASALTDAGVRFKPQTLQRWYDEEESAGGGGLPAETVRERFEKRIQARIRRGRAKEASDAGVMKTSDYNAQANEAVSSGASSMMGPFGEDLDTASGRALDIWEDLEGKVSKEQYPEHTKKRLDHIKALLKERVKTEIEHRKSERKKQRQRESSNERKAQAAIDAMRRDLAPELESRLPEDADPVKAMDEIVAEAREELGLAEGANLTDKRAADLRAAIEARIADMDAPSVPDRDGDADGYGDIDQARQALEGDQNADDDEFGGMFRKRFLKDAVQDAIEGATGKSAEERKGKLTRRQRRIAIDLVELRLHSDNGTLIAPGGQIDPRNFALGIRVLWNLAGHGAGQARIGAEESMRRISIGMGWMREGAPSTARILERLMAGQAYWQAVIKEFQKKGTGRRFRDALPEILRNLSRGVLGGAKAIGDLPFRFVVALEKVSAGIPGAEFEAQREAIRLVGQWMRARRGKESVVRVASRRFGKAAGRYAGKAYGMISKAARKLAGLARALPKGARLLWPSKLTPKQAAEWTREVRRLDLPRIAGARLDELRAKARGELTEAEEGGSDLRAVIANAARALGVDSAEASDQFMRALARWLGLAGMDPETTAAVVEAVTVAEEEPADADEEGDADESDGEPEGGGDAEEEESGEGDETDQGEGGDTEGGPGDGDDAGDTEGGDEGGTEGDGESGEGDSDGDGQGGDGGTGGPGGDGDGDGEGGGGGGGVGPRRKKRRKRRKPKEKKVEITEIEAIGPRIRDRMKNRYEDFVANKPDTLEAFVAQLFTKATLSKHFQATAKEGSTAALGPAMKAFADDWLLPYRDWIAARMLTHDREDVRLIAKAAWDNFRVYKDARSFKGALVKMIRRADRQQADESVSEYLRATPYPSDMGEVMASLTAEYIATASEMWEAVKEAGSVTEFKEAFLSILYEGDTWKADGLAAGAIGGWGGSDVGYRRYKKPGWLLAVHPSLPLPNSDLGRERLPFVQGLRHSLTDGSVLAAKVRFDAALDGGEEFSEFDRRGREIEFDWFKAGRHASDYLYTMDAQVGKDGEFWTQHSDDRPPPQELESGYGDLSSPDGPPQEGFPEWRENDRSVSLDELVETFGLKGGDVGNAIKKRPEGQRFLNWTYDALMDLVHHLQRINPAITPKLIGLNGTLNFEFATSGQVARGAAAHYAPGQQYINLTRRFGLGAVFHEWMHALDDHFSAGGIGNSESSPGAIYRLLTRTVNPSYVQTLLDRIIVSDRTLNPKTEATRYVSHQRLINYWLNRAGPIPPGVTESEHFLEALLNPEQDWSANGGWEPLSKFVKLYEWAYPTSPYLDDVAAVDRIKGGKKYYSKPEEMFARAGEAWLFDTLAANGQRDDVLVRPEVADGAISRDNGHIGRIYPSGDHRALLNRALTEYLSNVLTMTEEGGIVTEDRGVQVGERILHEQIVEAAGDWRARIEAAKAEVAEEWFKQEEAGYKGLYWYKAEQKPDTEWMAWVPGWREIGRESWSDDAQGSVYYVGFEQALDPEAARAAGYLPGNGEVSQMPGLEFRTRVDLAGMAAREGGANGTQGPVDAGSPDGMEAEPSDDGDPFDPAWQARQRDIDGAAQRGGLYGESDPAGDGAGDGAVGGPAPVPPASAGDGSPGTPPGDSSGAPAGPGNEAAPESGDVDPDDDFGGIFAGMVRDMSIRRAMMRASMPGANPENVAQAGASQQGARATAAERALRNAYEAMRIVAQAGERPLTQAERDVLRRFNGMVDFAHAFRDGSRTDAARAASSAVADALFRGKAPEGRKGQIHTWMEEQVERSVEDFPFMEQATWSILSRLGFKGEAGARVAHYSAGFGRLLSRAPREVRTHTRIELFEDNPLQARIANLLYGDHNVTVSAAMPEYGGRNEIAGSFDVAMATTPSMASHGDLYNHASGPTPLKGQAVFSPDTMKYDMRGTPFIEVVRPGGLAVMIVKDPERSWPDIAHGQFDYQPDESVTTRAPNHVVAAIDLPDIAIPPGPGGRRRPAAGWGIVVVRRGVKGDNVEALEDGAAGAVRLSGNGPGALSWKQLSIHSLADLSRGSLDTGVEHMVALRNRLRGEIESLDSRIASDSYLTRDQAYTRAHDLRLSAGGRRKRSGAASKATVAVRARNGVLQSRDGDSWRSIPKDGLDADAKGRYDAFVAALPLRDALTELFVHQVEGKPAGDRVAMRKALRKAYDKYVSEHGSLTEMLDGNPIALWDPEAPRLSHLERWDRESMSYQPSAMFDQDTLVVLKRPEPGSVETAEQALEESLKWMMRVDLPFMEEVTGMKRSRLVSDLVGSIFEDPDEGWKTRDEYLSGDVLRKWGRARRFMQLEPSFERNADALWAAMPAERDISRGEWVLPITSRLVRGRAEAVIEAFLTDLAGSSPARVMTGDGEDRVWDPAWYVTERGPSGLASGARRRALEVLDSLSPSISWPKIRGGVEVGRSRYDIHDIISRTLEGSSIRWRPSRNLQQYMDADELRTLKRDVNVDLQRKQRWLTTEFRSWANGTRDGASLLGYRSEGLTDLTHNEELRAELNEAFSAGFNRTVVRDYGNIQMAYPGSNALFFGTDEDGNPRPGLYPHQDISVYRSIEGDTMLAHKVGSGKSYSVIAAIMRARQVGLARTALLAVPGEKVSEMAHRDTPALFPDAEVFAPNLPIPNMGNKDEHLAALQRIRDYDGDFMILRHEEINYLPLPEAQENALYQQEVAKKQEAGLLADSWDEVVTWLSEALARADISPAAEVRWGLQFESQDTLEEAPRNLARYIISRSQAPNRTWSELKPILAEALEEAHKGESAARKVFDLTRDWRRPSLEELGIDMLVVDEAHKFKNVGTHSTIGRDIQGIALNKSEQGTNFKLRTDYIKKSGGRIVLATGSPAPNSLSELYSLQVVLDAKPFRDAGIYSFDDWLREFTRISYELRRPPSGGTEAEPGTAINEMVNVFAAMRITYQNVYGVDNDDLGFDLPELEGEEFDVVAVEPNEETAAIQEQLWERARDIMSGEPQVRLQEDENGKVTRKQDNMLWVIGDSRRVALDPALYTAEASADSDLKLQEAARIAKRIYDETNEWERPGGGKGFPGVIAIFSELFRSNRGDTRGYNAFHKLRDRLVEQGIPRNEIIIFPELSKSEKVNAQELLRTGRARVMLGTTQGGGTGLNIQEYGAAILNLDSGWNATSFEQRHGRFLRQGNRAWLDHGWKLRIHNLVMTNSIEAFMLETVSAKMRQEYLLRSGRAVDMVTLRAVTDPMQVAANRIIALVTGQDDTHQRLHSEFAELDAVATSFEQARREAERELAAIRGEIASSEAYIASLEDAKRTVDAIVGVRWESPGETEGTTASHRYRVQYEEGKPLPDNADERGRELDREWRKRFEAMARELADNGKPGDTSELATLDYAAGGGVKQLRVYMELFEPAEGAKVTPAHARIMLDLGGEPFQIQKGHQWWLTEADHDAVADGKKQGVRAGIRNQIHPKVRSEQEDVRLKEASLPDLERRATAVFPAEQQAALDAARRALDEYEDQQAENGTVGMAREPWRSEQEPPGDLAPDSVPLESGPATQDEIDKWVAIASDIVQKVAPGTRIDLVEDARNGALGRFYSQKGTGLEQGIVQITAAAFAGRGLQGVVHHEAFHALRHLGLLNADEWATLREHARTQGWMDRYDIWRRYESLLEDGEPTELAWEEAVAHGYEEWSNAKDEQPGWERAVVSLFQRVRRFFYRIMRAGRTSQDAMSIFERIRSGEIGERTRRVPPPFAEAAGTEGLNRVELPTEEAQRMWEEDRRGLASAGLKDPWWERLSEWSARNFQITRVHRELPNNEEWSRAHTWLRHLIAAPNAAANRVIRHSKDMIEGLTQEERDMLSDVVFMRDLLEDAREGKQLPGYWDSAEEFYESYKQLQAELKDPRWDRVKERARKRRAFVHGVATEMHKLGLISDEAVARSGNYITHEVLQYARLDQQLGRHQGPGGGSRLRTPHRHARRGTRLRINLNLLEAEAKWLSTALVDMATAQTIEKLRDDPQYNYRAQIVQMAREANVEGMSVKVHAEWKKALKAGHDPGFPLEEAPELAFNSLRRAVADVRKNGSEEKKAALDRFLANMPLFTAMMDLRQRIAASSSQLRSGLEKAGEAMIEDGSIPAWLAGAARQWASGDSGSGTSPHYWELVTWIAAGNWSVPESLPADTQERFSTDAMKGAAIGILSAIQQRESMTRSRLGSSYVPRNDMETAIIRLRALNPTDRFLQNLVAWQPDQGRILYTASTIPEKLTERAREMADMLRKDKPGFQQQLEEARAEGESVEDLIVEIAGSIRNVTAVGGPKYQMVVKSELASTLNTFKDSFLDSNMRNVWDKFVKYYKAWTLLNPARYPLYNLRNITGDLDHAIAVMGPINAFRNIGRATGELWRVGRGQELPSPEYRLAMEMGVLDAGIQMSEIIDRQKAVQRIIDEVTGARMTPKQALHRIISFFPKSSNFRENILRYSVFLTQRERYAELLSGEGFEKRGSSGDDIFERVEANRENVLKALSALGYGAAKRSVARGLRDWNDLIAYQARETLGDYSHISRAGRGIRKIAIPFYSWMEINFKFYGRLYYNAVADILDADASRSRAAADLGRAVVSSGLRMSLYHVIASLLWYGGMSLLNAALHGEDEEDLSEERKNEFYLMLWKTAGGEAVMLPAPGALADYLQWFGLQEGASAYHDWRTGEGSATAIPKAMLYSAANKLYQGLLPPFKLTIELIHGQSRFPDVSEPRPIRSKWQHAQKAASLDKWVDLYYAMASTGRPTKGAGHVLSSMFVQRQHIGASSYSRIQGLAYNWRKEFYGEQGTINLWNEKMLATYYYKLSMKYGDGPAGERYLRQMADLGITRAQYRRMIRSAHPLGMLSNRDRKLFLLTLTPEERRSLGRAVKYWNDTFVIRENAR